MAILIAFALIFLCAAPVVILYSKGYVFDVEQRRFVQTGALFLKTVPQDVVLKVGSTIKTVSQQGILYNGIFVRNLVPKTYHVEVASVQNPDVSWQKDLLVQPLVVTKETRIALPAPRLDPNTSAFATSSPSFTQLSGDTTLLYSSDDKRIETLDLVSGNQSVLMDLPASGQNKRDAIMDVALSQNQDQAVVTTASRTLFWFHGSFLDAPSYLATFMKNEHVAFSDLSFRWHPTQNQTLVILTPSAGYLLDTQANTYRLFDKTKVLGLGENGSGTYYVASNESIVPFGTQGQTGQPAGSLAQWSKTKVFWILHELPESQILAWQKNGPLVLLNAQTSAATMLGSHVTAMRVSPDQNRVVWADGNAISVTFLQNVFDDVQYAKDQTIRLAQEQEPVQNLFFTNDTWYVAATEQDQIAVLEIDTRMPINAWHIKIPTQTAFPYVDNASLYWISGANHSISDLFSN